MDAIDGRVALPKEYESLIDREKAQATLGKTMTDAEYACALSHALLCKEISQDSECDGAIILEDDAILSDDFFDLIKNTNFEQVDEKLIFFYHCNARVLKSFKRPFFEKYILTRPIKLPFGAVAYFVSKVGAKEIYESSMPIANVADWGFDVSQIDAKCVHPMMVQHPEIQPEQSTIKNRQQGSVSSFSRFFDPHYWRYVLQKPVSRKIS